VALHPGQRRHHHARELVRRRALDALDARHRKPGRVDAIETRRDGKIAFHEVGVRRHEAQVERAGVRPAEGNAGNLADGHPDSALQLAGRVEANDLRAIPLCNVNEALGIDGQAVGNSVILADAAAASAALNVKINLAWIEDDAFKKDTWAKVEAVLSETARLRDQVLALTYSKKNAWKLQSIIDGER
jgi:hypothetical protein